MSIFPWTEKQFPWNEIGPEIAATLHVIASMPMSELRQLPFEKSRPLSATPTIADIQAAVAEEFGVPRGNLIAKGKHKEYVEPRQVAIYLSHIMTGKTLPVIARCFNRTAATVAYSIRKMQSATGETAGIIARLRASLQP